MVFLRIHLLLALGVLAAMPAAAQEAAVAIVVNASVPDSLDLATIRRVYLARQRFWRDGSVARPVNQGARTEIRELFSRRALGSTPQQLSVYWNDLWFHGTPPPPVLGSDEAVLRFVSHTPGAIGYVTALSARAPPEGVRVAMILASP